MKDPIETAIGYHREWLKKNGTRMLGRHEQYLSEHIAEGTVLAFQRIPDSLYALATYFGIRGTVEVLDGQVDGWNNISTAIDFHGWSLKLTAYLFFRDPTRSLGLWNDVSIAACLICVSEKWGPMAEKILSRIDQKFWELRRVEPFVLQCCSIRDGEFSSADTLMEPYRSVIDGWSDEASLSTALESVCDYHVANMHDVGGDWDPEFKHSPFDLLPCEVMFVRRIREQLRLPIPNVTHDLARALAPFNAISSSNQEHEWLRKISHAFELCFR